VLVSVKPTIAVQPYALFPGEAVTVSGDNFGSGANVTVSATFPIQGGGTRTVNVTTHTGGHGNYSVRLGVPANAAPAKVTVTAHSANASVHTQIQVNQKPAPKPTATPVPSATPTSTPIPTSTPTPKHHHGFGFRYISIWYHTVRVGTYDHLVVQSTLHTQLGIWVHVWFPNVYRSLAYYQNTDFNGHWETQFTVPRDAITSNNNHVLVTFRLWHGKSNVKDFSGFRLVH
jgi:hypothetical protein